MKHVLWKAFRYRWLASRREIAIKTGVALWLWALFVLLKKFSFRVFFGGTIGWSVGMACLLLWHCGKYIRDYRAFRKERVEGITERLRRESVTADSYDLCFTAGPSSDEIELAVLDEFEQDYRS